MLRYSLRAASWALALTAISTLPLIDPPAEGERALLGRTAAGSGTLRLARPEGRVSAGRALLGELTAGANQADETIQIRPRRADGPGALLGRS
jgi:hypothetical protein